MNLSYSGRYAELYDLLYADKPYQKEVVFVDQCLRKFSQGQQIYRILELGCGTGTHAIELAKLGYDVTAIDLSEDMLAKAKAKAKRENVRIEFHQQDMRCLKSIDHLYDGVICLFDSIGHVCTNKSLDQVFQGVATTLRQGGLFMFEYWYSGTMLTKYEPVRVRRFRVPEGEIVRISETTIEHSAQLGHVCYTIFELQDNGQYSVFEEKQTNRFFLIQEMAAWLAFSGFSPVRWYSGFSENQNINDDTWHVIAVARRD